MTRALSAITHQVPSRLPSDRVRVKDNGLWLQLVEQHMHLLLLTLAAALERVGDIRVKVGLSGPGHKHRRDPGGMAYAHDILVRAEGKVLDHTVVQRVAHVGSLLLATQCVLPDLKRSKQ